MNDSTGMPQTAVVLGGTSEIAMAIVRALAARRLRHVLLAGRDEEGLRTAGRELDSLGVQVVGTVFWDATRDLGTDLAAEAAARLGEIDMVLVAAGILGDQGRCESDAESTSTVLRTNFTGPAAAMVSLSEVLRKQGHGRMVVLSSVAGVRVRRANFVYGSSKAGLDSFAQGLSYALRGDGVNVTIVRPGWVATRMTAGTPRGPMATTPEAVAADVVRGLERGSPVVWSPASLKAVFAVSRFVPSALWHRLAM